MAAPANAQQRTDVIFSAGPTGGSWTPMAAAASQVVNKRFPELNVQVEPGAALVNMEKIRTDKADIGWSMTTVMSPTVLMASSRTSDEVIYKVTKAIIEGRDEFGNVAAVMKGITAEEMAQNFEMPYHPGAQKYYREAKLIK